MIERQSRTLQTPTLVGVAIVFALLAARPASAASRQARANLARQACLDGNYAEGVAVLSKLFVETKNATYIFNQGRCFEQNRRYDDAIARFQEFLLAGHEKLGSNEKADADQHISYCKEMLAQERAIVPTSPAPQPVVDAPPVAPAASAPATAPEPTVIQQPAPGPIPPSGGAGLRTGGIVVATFGVAALGAGILLNVKANHTVNDMYSTYDGYSKESDRKTYEALAWVGYGLGAACVVTGAVLYGIGLKEKSGPASGLALVPVIGTSQAGAVLTGAF